MLYRCEKLNHIFNGSLNSTLINVLMTEPKNLIVLDGATYGCVVDVQQDLLYKAPVVIPGSDGVFRAFEHTDIEGNASIVSFFKDLSHPKVLPGYQQLPNLRPLPGNDQLPDFQYLPSGLGQGKNLLDGGSQVSNPRPTPSPSISKRGSDDQPVPEDGDGEPSQTATSELPYGESSHTISRGTRLSSDRLWGTALTLLLVLAAATILLF